MARLPQFVQLLFPVQLTTRGGIEQSVLDSCKRDTVNGRSFADIQAGLVELQANQRARQQLAFLDYAKIRKEKQCGGMGCFLNENVRRVPTFPQRPIFRPCAGYLQSRFAVWYDSVEPHIRAHLAAVDGKSWKLDWTFADARYMSCLSACMCAPSVDMLVSRVRVPCFCGCYMNIILMCVHCLWG